MALNSTSVIKIVDLLCEGPISGLVGTEEGILLDETAIRTGNSRNFLAEDVSYDFKPGGRTQSELVQGRNGTSTITDVNVEIGERYQEDLNESNQVINRKYGGGQVIRQITDTEVESFELLLTIPKLFSVAQEGLAKGQTFNASIKFAVDVQAKGQAYNTVYERTVTGVATSNFQFKTPRIDLVGQGPWNIRVRKIDLGEDHFEVKFRNFQEILQSTPLANGRANQIFWTSLIEIQSLRTGYPFCAVAGLSLSTKQFSSLPTRAYKVRGRIVQIPSNAQVRADGSLDFTGAFDGSLLSAWTTCPVCCWYDMITNPRFGAGDFVEASNISWVDLYPLARYANQLITNPDGSVEPRFACNMVIGARAEAFNVLQDLASVFRGMLYWQANTIQASADHGNLDGTDVSPVHLYSNSNVIDGAFNYSGTSLKTRSTKIRVRYNDPDNFYKSNYVCVEDASLISKYGYQEKEIVAFGATSKYQAQRLGRWMLAAEERDGEVISFSTGLQGAVVLPGQVFAVADEMRQEARLSGRVSSATATQVTVDQSVTLPAGELHTLTCTLADGSIETKEISSVSGAAVNTDAFSSAPLAQSIWSIQSTVKTHQKFRCLSVIDNGNGQYSVSGVEHNDSIYSTADSSEKSEYEDVDGIGQAPASPTGLTVSFKEVTVSQVVTNRMTASWSRGIDSLTFGFDVRYKVGNGNYIEAQTTDARFEVDGLEAGTSFTIEVRSISAPPVSRKSGWIAATQTVPSPNIDPDNPGAVIRPVNPAGVTIQAIEGDQAILRWEIPVTGQNTNNLLAIIRHSPRTDGLGEWPSSTLLRTVEAQTTQAVLPLIEGEYLVKFQDQNGQRSITAGSAVISLPNRVPRLNIEVRNEHTDTPSFQGNKTNVIYDPEYNGLILDGDARWDDIVDLEADFPASPLRKIDDLYGTRASSGEYFFRSVLDLGGVFNVLFTRKLRSNGLYPSQSFDDRIELIDRWSDIDGDIPDDTSAEVYVRTSNQAVVDDQMLLEDASFFLLEDGTNKIELESSVSFGPWVPMESGRSSARLLQFKCLLNSTHIDQTPVVDELGYTMQLESRTESSESIDSGAGAKVVTFNKAFYQEPSIGITASNLASGDYYEVTSASRTGFTVTFKNSSNTAVSRSFQYQAVGHGTEQT